MPDNNKTTNINNGVNDPALANYLKYRTTGTLNTEQKEIGLAAPTYGESQFDTEASIPTVESGELDFYRGERQSRLDKMANAIPRLVSKVGTEIAKTPAYIYALGEAGFTDKTLAESLDNAWINGLEHVDQSVKDQFAIYKPKSVVNGDIWDNLTSTSFWTDEGVDGLGFLVSMMAPGAALKATGIAGKLAGLPRLTELLGTSKTALQSGIEIGQATLLNTALESAAETKSLVDNLKIEFDNKISNGELNPKTGKLWTEQEAKDAIGEAAVSTFQMNMGVLLVPNLIMNKNLLGRFGADKSILNSFRDASGRLIATNPITRKQIIKQYAKSIGTTALSEGFLEEGSQTTIENYNTKVALNQTNKGVLEGLANEYLETLGTTEGQKSILLGAVLGALGAGYGTRKRVKAENSQRATLSKLIGDNFEGFSTSMDSMFQKDSEGKVIIDQETNKPVLNTEEVANVVSNLIKEQQSTNLMDLAALDNDEDLYDHIFNAQLARFALPYLNVEGGTEILNQHIDDLSDNVVQSNSNHLEDTQYRNEVKQTIKDLKSVYDSVRESINDINLESLSNDIQLTGRFANILANTAYQESSKQLFLSKKIDELEKELLTLRSKSSGNVTQFTIDSEKIVNRLTALKVALEESKNKYDSVFNKEQQIEAFRDFSDFITEQQNSITEQEALQETTNTNTNQSVNNEENQSTDDLLNNIDNTEIAPELISTNGFFDEFGNYYDDEGGVIPAPTASSNELNEQTETTESITNSPNANLRSLANSNTSNQAENAYTTLDSIDFNDPESIDNGISKILEIVNDKFIPKDKESQVLSTKSKLIGNNNYRTFDYLEKYITTSLKDFKGKDVLELLGNKSIDNTDYVSESLITNNSDITRTANEQIVQNPREVQKGLYSDISKGVSKMANVVMMKLFNNYFENGVFRFERDDNGLPIVDNNSNINIDALNRINIGDTITFNTIELTSEALENYNKSKQESISHINHNITNMGNLFNYSTSDKNYGFDDKHIGIYHNNDLIGFVQQPHAISNSVEDSSKQDYIDARNEIVEQRKAILRALENGVVSTTVKTKGSGNLYTKLKDGKIDLINDLFSAPRPKDLTTSKNLIFVYNDGTKLDLPKMDDTKMESDIKSRLSELGNWGSKGSVFQLVQDTTGKWYPIPVYTNLINDTTSKTIIKALKTLSSTSKYNDVISALNPYIYATNDLEKNAPIKIDDRNNTSLTIDGKTYLIDDLNKGIGLADFKKALLTKRQNISVLNINSRFTQKDLKTRNTLGSNALTYKGEYLVQPFLSFESIISSEELTVYEQTEDKSIEEINDNSEEETLLDKIIRLKGPSDDPGFSRSNKGIEINIEDSKKWLNTYLPGLTISDINDLDKLKTNITDAFGAYRNMVIYLFNGSTNQTLYHEAFHGVFRNMLSKSERLDLLNEAYIRYEKPSKSDLSRLQETLSSKANTDQLNTLYYEEKLADEFAEYTDNRVEKSLLGKIKDFFNKIISFFDIFTLNNQSKIDELFEAINKKEFVEKSTVSKKNNLQLVNRELTGKTFDNLAFVRSEVFTATFKWDRTKSIGDNFMNTYQSLKDQGETNIVPSNIFKMIYQKYVDISKDEKALMAMSASETANLKKILDVNNFTFLQNEAIKYLESYGLKVNLKEEVQYEETNLLEENIADEEITSLASQTTKGLGEWITQAGLKSASMRLKMFLSSIPVTNKGIVQLDSFGFTKFHDFNKLYYFLERSLTGIHTFEDMLSELQELSEIRPEIQTVINKLTKPDSFTSEEELTKLQNDFKSNFSKQQLSYTLVKFDTDSKTGEVTYRIFDANRMSVNRTTESEWKSNLTSGTRESIAEFRDDQLVFNGTSKALSIRSQYEVLSKDLISSKADYNALNSILLQVGIEFSPDVLKTLIDNKSKILDYNLKQILDFHSNSNPTTKDYEIYDKAFKALVNLETSGTLLAYTQSFNNVENSSIYTIQLPSFASKIIDDLTDSNAEKFYSRLDDFRKDPLYTYSNLLNDLESDANYRTSQFRLNYLDGLKDEKGTKDGSKFTNMSPKDFMSMQIALFQNLNNNGNKVTKSKTSKYIYITPSDKTMAMIFDAKSYNASLTNSEITINTPIVNNFYNVLLQEASRIKQQLDIKNNILNGAVDENGNLINIEKDLLDHYHFKPKSNRLAFDGFAYQIMHFGENFNSQFNQLIIDNLYNSDNIEESLSNIEQILKQGIVSELQQEYNKTIEEAVDKGVITNTKNGYESLSLDKLDNKNIPQTIANFALNTWLNNIEMSNILNGDVALYKAKDLQKRTYQSGAMGVNINIEGHSIARTKVVKDYTSKSDLEYLRKFAGDIVDNYNKNNVTDAQVLVSPSFYRDIMIGRGTWSSEMQTAFDIAEGIITNPTYQQLKDARLKLSNIKPFYFGNRFDDKLGIQRYEQVKCAMLPLFKSYVKDNPLLATKREEMDNDNLDMIAFESSFKAAIGYRTEITSNESPILELDMNNFMIQVDNPAHILDEQNDSIRQLKMLLLGNIDPNKSYSDKKGSDIISEINNLEGYNLRESLNHLVKLIRGKSSTEFKQYMKEMLTKRNATDNIIEALNVIGDEFEYALDNGTSSTAIENLISSLFTNKVIKQAFEGGSGVQASAIGMRYKGGNTELDILQSDLKYFVSEDGKTFWSEAIMPAWSSEFFNKDGFIRDDIPDNLKELIFYRIPTEGFHSTMPIKVKGFLPVEYGNTILMPYEVTTQFGADFDFDKIYYLVPEFTNNNGKLEKVLYDDSKGLEENSRSARNNKILDNYIQVLSSKEILPLILNPSGFEYLAEIKANIDRLDNISSNTRPFFSTVTQRDYKTRNHVGIGLKGQLALHVSGHSYATLLNIFARHNALTKDNDEFVKFTGDAAIMFNSVSEGNLSKQYSFDGKLISKEVSALMAAVLDDIKNPIIQALGINQFTADVWATIVRAGFDSKTAVNFVTQPSVVELSRKLAENNYKIKSKDAKRHSVDTLMTDYWNILGEIKKSLNEEQLELLVSNYNNIYDENMEYYRHWYALNKNHLFLNGNKKNTNFNFELAQYYNYQYDILNRYKNYEKLAKDLVKINRLFGVNKEVGPNFEDIVNKKYLLDEIESADFSIGGLNRDTLSTIKPLNEAYNTQVEALDFLSEYFPYDSPLYNAIKFAFIGSNIRKDASFESLSKISVKDRIMMNSFIRTFIDYKSDVMLELNNNSENERTYFEVLPKLIDTIKNPQNDHLFFNGALRNNVFFENLQATYDEKSKLSFITIKGNKLDIQLKNNISESIYSMFKNEATRPLIEQLIKYSFVATGFHTGLRSFHDLIPPIILKELGYSDYRKSVTKSISLNNYNMDSNEINRLVDQMVRNFSTTFTKSFDTKDFYQRGNNLEITFELAEASGRAKEIMTNYDLVKNGVDYPRFIKYIRVYDSVAKKSILYKLENNSIYKPISKLGKPGYLLEINVLQDIDQSINSDNNLDNKEINTTFVDETNTNETLEKPVLEQEFQDPDIQDISDLFEQPENLINNNINMPKEDINFQEEQSSGYRNRTIKNASADITIAIAVDFNSAGEKLTKSSVLNQGKTYLPIDANNLNVTQDRVDRIVKSINDISNKQVDLFGSKGITLNIAGNGIYTMKGKYTQDQIDEFTYNLLKQVIESPNLKAKIASIRSGGQTGFDEAGAKASIRLGIPTIVLAPKGWTFRNISGQDISDEKQFKDRFNNIINDDINNLPDEITPC